MMEEFSVLLEEHRAMRICANALVDAAERGRDRVELGALLRPLAWMASSVHAPKENSALLDRLARDAMTNTTLLHLMGERSRVEAQLSAISAVWSDAVAVERGQEIELVDVVIDYTQLMDAEERVLYPTVYMQCTDDDLWEIGVALDRRIDQAGRLERADFIRRHAHVFQVV